MLMLGAMMVSLGQGIAGAFTPSDDMAAKIATASSETGARPLLMSGCVTF